MHDLKFQQNHITDQPIKLVLKFMLAKTELFEQNCKVHVDEALRLLTTL